MYQGFWLVKSRSINRDIHLFHYLLTFADVKSCMNAFYSSRLVHDQPRTVADHPRAIADYPRTIAVYLQTIADRARTIADHLRSTADVRETFADVRGSFSDLCGRPRLVRERSAIGSRTLRLIREGCEWSAKVCEWSANDQCTDWSRTLLLLDCGFLVSDTVIWTNGNSNMDAAAVKMARSGP